MTRKAMILGLLFLYCSSLSAADNAGKSLLDNLTRLFRDYAEKGTPGGQAQIGKDLEGLMAAAKKYRDEKQIDTIFFKRYGRMLMVMKLMFLEDKQGILGPLIEKEIGNFVEDVMGERLNASGNQAIGAVAGALENEILNLHFYLDNEKLRAKAKKDFEKQYQGKK